MKYFAKVGAGSARGLFYLGAGGIAGLIVHQSLNSFLSGLFAGLVLFLLLSDL
tara:strand:- start:1647 stop:1805 length:159 start_codon:yes stop_codon:yes gene_type:complete